MARAFRAREAIYRERLDAVVEAREAVWSTAKRVRGRTVPRPMALIRWLGAVSLGVEALLQVAKMDAEDQAKVHERMRL